MDVTSSLVLWCSARAAALLQGQPHADSTATSCCASLLTSSSRLLPVRIVQQRTSAGLICVEWSCSSEKPLRAHSRWVDPSLLSYVTHAATNANALLGRGSHEKPFEQENEGQLTLWTSPQLGRFVASKATVRAGTCVMRATAFAVVVSNAKATTYCHWCFTKLAKKAFRCGACEFALYCSRDCLDADAILHDVQCETLAQLKAVSSDTEMLRLVLAVLAMEVFVQNTHALANVSVAKQGDHQPQVDKAALWLYKSLKKTPPPLRVVTRAHITTTLQKLQYNSHPLYLNGSSGVCGLGIFPEAAMTINHSCAPNVVPVFDPRTRSLRFHAIQQIQQLELIEYSYLTDLSISTPRRQQMLRDGFGFVCECRRCVGGGGDHASEPSLHSVEETEELTKQFMRLSASSSSHTSDPLQLLGELHRLTELHSGLLAECVDLSFALKTLELRAATKANDWRRTIVVAETLLSLWHAQALSPYYYPTTELLHQQIALAATRLGDNEKTKQASERVDEIQRIYGL